MDARQAIEQYKATYESMYGHKPPAKCVESFCRINKIEQPEEDVIIIPPHVDMLFGGEMEG